MENDGFALGMVGIDLIDGWLRRQRFRWYLHMSRRGKYTEKDRVLTIKVAKNVSARL